LLPVLAETAMRVRGGDHAAENRTEKERRTMGDKMIDENQQKIQIPCGAHNWTMVGGQRTLGMNYVGFQTTDCFAPGYLGGWGESDIVDWSGGDYNSVFKGMDPSGAKPTELDDPRFRRALAIIQALATIVRDTLVDGIRNPR
jgi:hypothetical protein